LKQLLGVLRRLIDVSCKEVFEMKGRYLKKIGGIILAALMLSGVAFVSAGTLKRNTGDE
jgi:hypothetical protein